MVARIRKPLKFRVFNRIVGMRERSRTGASSGYDIQSTPTGQTLDSDDALALDVVDLSVLIVVMVVIGVISVAAMVVPVIGHGVSDCGSPDAANHRAHRTPNNSPGDSAADRSSNRAAFIGKSNLR